MVKAELVHNPYLLKTEVKFNEQEPKINCQIEKYVNQPLKDWVSKVPQIFYDEMNGYDFDFYFTGTVPDYKEVMAAFEEAGVTSEQVRLFYRNELEDSITKSAEVDDLLNWLKQNPNRNFDYEQFWEIYGSLFEESYPLVVIGSNVAPEKMSMSISPESVASAEELTSTNLSSTPIIFCINENNRKQIRKDLLMILNRKDIRQEQLFFMIDLLMDVKQVKRVIYDLGVKIPQLVDSPEADVILSYVRNYPVTEHIRDAIKVFDSIVERIDQKLGQENKRSKITNDGIHHEIEIIDQELGRYKRADVYFVQKDNLERPEKFLDAELNLRTQLLNWRNRKTKIVGDSDATIAAIEFSDVINRTMKEFYDSVTDTYLESRHKIEEKFSMEYGQTTLDFDYRPDSISVSDYNTRSIPLLITEFLNLKEVTYENSKNDFLGLFKKPNEITIQERVVTYYIEQWRSKAVEVVMPLAFEFVGNYCAALEYYYDAMAEKYHEHLTMLIADRSKDKERTASRLSDDEKKLQEDNDWMENIKDRLLLIKEG